MREVVTHSQRLLSITSRYLANGKNKKIADLEFITVTSQSTGIAVLETCFLLDRQPASE